MNKFFIIGTLLIVLLIGGGMTKCETIKVDETSVGYALIHSNENNQSVDINMLMSMRDKKTIDYGLNSGEVKINGVIKTNAFKKSFEGTISINGIVYDSFDKSLLINSGEFEQQGDLYIYKIGDEKKMINIYLDHENKLMVSVYEKSEYKNLSIVTSYFFDKENNTLEDAYENFNLYA